MAIIDRQQPDHHSKDYSSFLSHNAPPHYNRINITVLGNNKYTIGSWQIEDAVIPRILADITALPNGVLVVAGGYQVSCTLYCCPILCCQLRSL